MTTRAPPPRARRARRGPRAGSPAGRPRSSPGRGSPPGLRLLPHLDRDLFDRQWDRRLGLRRLNAHGLGAEAVHQPLGHGGAEPLERLVVALLGAERDLLAHLGVVHGVLDAVGDRGVAFVELEGDVEDEPLADLALRLADAVMGVEREPRDLYRDGGRRGAALVAELVVVELVVVVVRLSLPH